MISKKKRVQQVLKALGLTEDRRKLPRAEAVQRARGKPALALPHRCAGGATVTE